MLTFRKPVLDLFAPFAALIRSSLLSDITGSIGGTTYARCRGGSYARNRTNPYNPQTVAQGTVRSMLGSLSMNWNALTQEQRDAWNEYAMGLSVFNRLGQSYAPSGRQAFIQQNQNLQIIAASTIDDPPATTVAPVMDIDWLAFSVKTDVGVPGTKIGEVKVIDVGPHAGSMTYQIKLSPPLVIARGQSYRNRTRGQGQFVSDQTAISTPLTSQYKDTFGGTGDVAADPGMIINYQVRCIDPATGLSCAYIASNVAIVQGI